VFPFNCFAEVIHVRILKDFGTLEDLTLLLFWNNYEVMTCYHSKREQSTTTEPKNPEKAILLPQTFQDDSYPVHSAGTGSKGPAGRPECIHPL
jgi:hypothetical protein